MLLIKKRRAEFCHSTRQLGSDEDAALYSDSGKYAHYSPPHIKLFAAYTDVR